MAFEGLRQLFGRDEEFTDEQKKRRKRVNLATKGAVAAFAPATAGSLISKEQKKKVFEFGKNVVQGTARNLALVASGLFAPLPEGQKPTMNPKKRFEQFADNPVTVQSKAASMLFGKPQGESFSLKSEGGEFLSSFGAGENTQKKLAAPLGVFLGTLDAAGIPAGKIAKEAKVLVKLTDELEIIPKIKKMFPGASELDIEELSRRVANISDEKEIESILKNPQKVLEEAPAVVDDVVSEAPKAVPETKLSLKDNRGFIASGFKNEGDLTTKILKDLEGKTTVSKQYILDATNRGELKQVERDLIRRVLDDMNPKPKSESYIYHSTTKGGIEGILEKGLTKDVADIYPHGQKLEDSIGKMIYFADTPEATLNAGTFKTGNFLRVNKNNLDQSKLVDRKMFKRLETRYWGNDISPADIEIKTSNGWENLLDHAEENYPEIMRDMKKNNMSWTRNKPSSDTINVKEFADKVKSELLPLKVKNETFPTTDKFKARYENITLPDELRGAVKNYKEKSPINLSKYDLSDAEKARFAQFLNDADEAIESSKGAKVSWDEIAEAAKGAQALEKGMTRTETLDLGASIYKTRQKLNSVLKADGTIDEEAFKEAATKIVPILEEFAADAGRQLNFLKMKVGDEGTNALLEKLLKMKDKTDEILKAAKGVNLNNPAEALKLYRQFEKARFWDVLTEYRYANMLSSPRTHIINAFSNVIQGSILRPLTKLTTGVFDSIGSALTGKAREAYAREVPAYYKGAFNAVPDAARKFVEVMSGKIPIEQLDLKRLPTNSKFMKYTGLRYVSRLMEANDVLFRTMIENGEREALALRAVKKGEQVNARTMVAINKKANETALEYVFRKPLDTMNETGQGSVLSGIDKATALIMKARDLPGVGWFVPFIQTPMNILKQGIEFSPLGALTLINNTRKTEQLAKMAIGSAVFVGAGALALEGKTTWGAPKNANDREAFYASGRRPYSVKIGDNWVSYSKLGPLAYPMALASAVQYYWNENPDSYDEETHNKALLVLQGISEFLADQSYMQGLSEIMGSLTGAPGSKGVIPTTIDTFTGQLIPLSSLQRWVNNFIDPIYRKQENDVSVEAIINNLKPNIIGLKSQMDAYTNPDGTESERDYPGLNAFSPMEISASKPEGEELYTEGLKMRKIANQRKVSDADVQTVVNELDSLPLSQARVEFIKLKMENPALAQRVESQKKKEALEYTPLQKRISSLNVTDGTRAEYIYTYVNSLPVAERAKVVAELRAKKIITKTVEQQLEVIARTQ